MQQISANRGFKTKIAENHLNSVKIRAEGGFWVASPDGATNLASADLKFIDFPGNFQHPNTVNPGPVPSISNHSIRAVAHSHWDVVRHVAKPSELDVIKLRSLMDANPSIVGGLYLAIQALTYSPHKGSSHSELSMDILHGCNTPQIDTRESSRNRFFDRLDELEKELNGRFSKEKREDNIMFAECGTEYVLFNWPMQDTGNFGGVVYLRFEVETNVLVKEQWG
ncbi:MAG: hypothetical protein AAF986_05335 [Pseudomonadota bacterium]